MYLEQFLRYIDARANVEIWEGEKELSFNGKAYKLFDDFPRLCGKKIKTIKTTINSLQILLENED